MKPARARLPACALLSASLAATAAACSTDEGDVDSISLTNVYADPNDFRGDVLCQRYEGALQSYVVTLFEAPTAGREDVPVSPISSPPSACTQRVGFGDQLIRAERAYSAVVDAYDYPVCDGAATVRPCIVPYNGIGSPGGRAMALVIAGDPNLPDDPQWIRPDDPRWQPLQAAEPPPEWLPVQCDAVTARLLASIRLASCAPVLKPRWPDGGLALSVDALRGPLPCAPAEGDAVSRVVVEYTDIIDASGAAGGAGAAGSAGSAGDAGASGGPGDAGSAGAAGSSGDAGSTGAAGSSGDAAGAGGDAGAAGAGGGAGAPGGAAGAVGGAGGSGVAGPIREPSKEPRAAACTAGAEVRYERGELTPGVTYGFRASAFDGGGVLRWSTSCEGTPVAGIGNFPIACAPLADEGALRVPFEALARAYTERFDDPTPPCAGPNVPPPFVQGVEAALGGEGPLQAVACGSDLRFDRLVPGAYTLRGVFNVVVAEGGTQARPFVCEGFVAGGNPTAVGCLFL